MNKRLNRADYFIGLAGILIAVAFIIFLFSGCATQKNAEKYYALHPYDLASKCAKEYPAQITPGVTIHKVDTAFLPGIRIPCPEPKIDSEGQIQPVFVDCPPTRVIHDTTSIHDQVLDVALVTALRGDTAAIGQAYRRQTERLNTTIGERDKARDQAKTRLFELIILSIACAFFLFLVVKFIIL